MTKVKICGLTRERDIEIVNRHLPDYAGFVFSESRRRIAAGKAAELCAGFDRRIKKAGVFVNEKLSDVLEIAAMCRLDVIQVHGDESPEFISCLKKKLPGVEVWKAVRVRDANSITKIRDYFMEQEYFPDAIVLDAYSNKGYGGTGKTFDWKIAKEAAVNCRIILAGGLAPENVKEAVEIVCPYAVDVSSGVETEGYKDEIKIRDFINAVRRPAGRFVYDDEKR